MHEHQYNISAEKNVLKRTNCIRFTIQEIKEQMSTKNNIISDRSVLISPVK